MKIFFSPECLEYTQPGHPESAERIRSIYDCLKQNHFKFVLPTPCREEDILRVHTEALLTSVKYNTFFDVDTPNLPDIYQYALLSAGSAILACEAAAEGEITFSLMRPPGHHATRNRVMGFCYFNNIAVAVAKYLEKNPEKQVAILDIDCHHGNGTQDIFFRTANVLYVSLHQVPLFPGTGLRSSENAINYPLPVGTSGSDYLNILENACQTIADRDPSLIGISAGFDTYREDPLSQMELETTTFGKMGRMIANLAKPVFMVMEGGYSANVPQCVLEFLQGCE